jgi:hypothetical protein
MEPGMRAPEREKCLVEIRKGRNERAKLFLRKIRVVPSGEGVPSGLRQVSNAGKRLPR